MKTKRFTHEQLLRKLDVLAIPTAYGLSKKSGILFAYIYQRCMQNGFDNLTNISFSDMKKVVGDNVVTYKGELISHGLIFHNEKFAYKGDDNHTKAFSQSYKILLEGHGIWRKGFEIVKTPKLKGERLIDVKPDTHEHYQHQILLKVSFRSLAVVVKMLEDFDFNTKSVRSYNNLVTYARMIANHLHFCKRGQNSNRLFHTLVCCPKELRQLLKFEKCSLVEGDIKSCYLQLMLSFYQPLRNESSEVEDERSKFISLIESGFYERLIQDLHPTIKIDSKSRNKMKRFFQVFVAKINTNKWYIKKMLIWFETEFPILTELLKDTDKLPLHMQNTESDLMVDYMTSVCCYLQIPYVSTHDGFLTTNEHFETVKKALVDEARRRYDYDFIITS